MFEITRYINTDSYFSLKTSKSLLSSEKQRNKKIIYLMWEILIASLLKHENNDIALLIVALLTASYCFPSVEL